jgi:hypothetical protein
LRFANPYFLTPPGGLCAGLPWPSDSGAKISEHARGNALDLGQIRLANGTLVELGNRFVFQSVRQRLRDTACHRFTTVLGPGADPFHENHIHIDLAERARGYRPASGT